MRYADDCNNFFFSRAVLNSVQFTTRCVAVLLQVFMCVQVLQYRGTGIIFISQVSTLKCLEI